MKLKSSIICAIVIFSTLSHAEDTLEEVIEMIRHGARGPIEKSYDYSEQLNTVGQLTSVGIHQTYQLGQQMRREYIEKHKLLSPQYNQSEVLFFSTQTNRTLMSAQSHLIGLYPPLTGNKLQITDNNIIYPPYKNIAENDVEGGYSLPFGMQVLPIYSVSDGKGSIIPYTCPNYEQMENDNFIRYKELIGEIDSKHSQLFKDVSKFTGEKYDSILNISKFEDVMTSDIFSGRPLPEGLTQSQIELIRQLRSLKWIISLKGDLTTALFSNTISFIVEQFQQKVNGESNKKFVLLSCHDSNLSMALTFFNASSPECLWQKYNNKEVTSFNCVESPGFASNLNFELFKSQSQQSYYIKIKYNGSYLNLCETNSASCSLNEFLERVNYQIGDYQKLCGLENVVNSENTVNIINTQKQKDDYSEVVMLLCILVIFSFLLSIFLGIIIYQKKNQLNNKDSTQVSTKEEDPKSTLNKIETKPSD